jgi:inhibitor of KinA sporulation pathway (predicted exonuclease)
MPLKLDYSRFLILDLEATCWPDISREEQSLKNEIIQFGIVEVDLVNRCISREMSYFVKPKKNKILSSFCTELTGITQEQVDSAHDLTKISKEIRTFFNPGRVAWGAWGDDYNLIKRDCLEKNAVNPFNECYYDLQQLYAIKTAAKQRTTVANAMNQYGLTFEGSAHNALVDARNTAQLFLKML